MANEAMTKSERTELGQLIRKRERFLKAQAVERSAAMLSEFESKCAAIYSFDQDDVWKESFAEAEKVVADAERIIAERAATLGIPKEFAPSINLHWYGRGENAVAKRRTELRMAAKAKIAKLEKAAIVKIEHMSLEAQTEIIANGLVTDAAKGFLEQMPSIEMLMPTLDDKEIKLLGEEQRN